MHSHSVSLLYLPSFLHVLLPITMSLLLIKEWAGRDEPAGRQTDADDGLLKKWSGVGTKNVEEERRDYVIIPGKGKWLHNVLYATSVFREATRRFNLAKFKLNQHSWI